MSNNLPVQDRDAKNPVPTPNTYPASPSHLPLSAGYNTTGLQNPYQGYSYSQDSSAFSFIPQSHYRPQLQTLHQTHQQQQPQPPPPQPQQPPPAAPQASPLSPARSRKRAASELDAGGPSGSNTSFSRRPGLVIAGSGLEEGVGPSETQLSSPTAKKGRTNTPWTPAEEHLLKSLKDTNMTWQEIAKRFPQRTEGSVKKHWYKDMHYADFAQDEEQVILAAMKDYDRDKWKVIGQKVGKPAKACEQLAKDKGWIT